MPPREALTQDALRRRNLADALGYVHAHGPTTRATLTAALGLNRSTIGGLTAELAAAGLVREVVPGGGAGTGRPSYVVVPESRRVSVIAVALAVDTLTVARVGLGGVVLCRGERRHDREGRAFDAVLEAAAELCEELLAAVGPGELCLGVGVSVPGAVRDRDGLVRFAPNLGWVDEPLGTRLAARLHRTVRSGNDADLGVLAEHLRGAAMGVDDVVYLAGGVGLGGGIVVGGVPLRGSGGYAGEVGHMGVDPLGVVCRCGSVGCWETTVGEDALLVAAGWPAGGGADAVAEVVRAAAAGEPRAAAALTSVAGWTGRGLGALVNVLNPGLVVLGGCLGQVYAARAADVHAALVASTLTAPREQVGVRAAALGGDSSLFGAAELAFAPLLRDPLRALAALAPLAG